MPLQADKETVLNLFKVFLIRLTIASRWLELQKLIYILPLLLSASPNNPWYSAVWRLSQLLLNEEVSYSLKNTLAPPTEQRTQGTGLSVAMGQKYESLT